MPPGAQPALHRETDPVAQPFPAAVYLWLSPGFPVGAFAYSHGLEWAIGAGRVASADDLATWLSDLVAHGSARNDLIFAALAYRRAGVDAELRELLDLAVAMQPGAERRAETINQGNAFAAAIRSAWPCREMDLLANLRPGEIAYPVALGVAAAAHAQPLTVVLNAYGLSFVANMVSAAQRLSLIGQTDGQRVLARLTDTIACAASAAIDADIEDLASAAFVSDLASLLHETSDQRMFRT